MEPSAGTYNIYYSSTDLYNTTSNRTRILDVADRTPPLITICGDFYYTLSGGSSYYIPNRTIYIEYGAYAYDAGTRTQIYDISITKITEQKITTLLNGIIETSYVYIPISNNTLTSQPLIYNTNSLRAPDYRILYSASDKFDNSQSIIRNIFVTPPTKPKLYPYIEVSTSDAIIEYSLLGDISINIRLINTTGIGSLFYDLSLSFKNETDNSIANNKNIICEAVKSVIFRKGGTNNCVKFKLRATNANDISLTSSFINVEYETIDSINIEKTHKIYFYARDLSQTNIIDQISFLEYNLNFVDTTPPQVNLLTNRNFESNSNLNYPLLSATSINDLSINIASYANFNNIYNNYENYYKKTLSNNIVLIDPGINISDIVSGEVNYIDNSFLKINSSTSYSFVSSDISINYYKYDGSLIDVCNILFLANDIRQSYQVRDGQGNISETRSRTINVARFQPFINLNYQLSVFL
jgi:hypothetical protein